MKKIFNFMMIALVAMVGFASCSEDCDHNFAGDNHSADLVGTWTCLQEGFAEALVIKADGSMVATGVAGDKFWENVNGNITVKDGKATLDFEDDVTIEGHFDIIPGIAFSIKQENGERVTFNYCKEDLSDEIVGMWVNTLSSSPNADVENKIEGNDMAIQTYQNDGKAYFTGYLFDVDQFITTGESTYEVVGDLLFQKLPTGLCLAMRLGYSPNGTALGDIMTLKQYIAMDNNVTETTTSWLRIKRNLSLAGKAYDYSATYISNVKGEDKDVPFLNTSFNFAKMNGSIIDKFLKSTLFSVEFPDANTIKYSFLVGSQNTSMTAPIEVEGNKMTIKMSESYPVLQDIEVYTFQDQDNTQMHLYMPTASFEKFFANTSVFVMLGSGQLDINDTEAIAGVYQTVADAIESINLTIVMK